MSNSIRTKVLYHGTKHDEEEVMNNPQMMPSANGYGFYLTTNIMLASSYGEVIAYVVPWDFEVDMMRVMEEYVDTRFEGELEYVINSQATMVKFLKTMEDAYLEPYATPF